MLIMPQGVAGALPAASSGSSLFGAQAGVYGANFASAAIQFGQQYSAKKFQQQQQNYNNAIQRINTQEQLNAINLNKRAVETAELSASMGIQQEALTAKGSAEVMAAATGQAGSSIKDVMADVDRAEAYRLEQARVLNDAALLNLDAQSRTATTQGDLAIDKTRYQTPSILEPMLHSSMQSYLQLKALGLN